jgi:hypothetical protein
MPSRKSEFYAERKEGPGQPLCPFCGSKDVYPIKEKRLIFFEKTVAWSCANEGCRMYRKQFPSPSWGAGGSHR